ncbi:exodeoxyribonuclease V subunit gamma [Leptospira sarikeiensis]|uniref:Exodeoxyribonuclease V subunit gamma n=2 Tax=Leptospira sarikeiensis TaxID=2484943 RepID=A0A4R9K3T4_9LEPT|nr:exodeoxyribonuclease V subunit gamma [Leptospira sarikeiensis]
MPIRVNSSDSLSDLSEILAKSLRQEISKEDGLYSPTIIIPNKSMETWLNLDLVERFGVVFNIRFLFLEKYLEEVLLQKFSPEIDPHSRPFLQSESRKFQIYETLLQDRSFLDKYPILKNYLLPSGRKTADPIRLLDLSGRLAKYFKDYELNRQDWIRNWLGEKYSILRLPGEDIWEEVATQSEIFFFQKELYSYLTHSDENKETLIQYAMKKLGLNSENQKSQNVYLFALSQLSSTYISIFRDLLPEIKLEVFQFGVPKGDIISGTERNQICRNWANSFRSLKKAWETAGAEFPTENTHKKNENVSVLSELQKYLIEGNEKIRAKISPDESFQILEVPGKVREVEAIFHHILSILEGSKETKLTDFGIFCSDLSEYRAAIEFVFEGGIQAKLSAQTQEASIKTLPYSIRDVMASEISPYLSGILSIFPLLTGERSRANLFRLFRNVCFQSKWEIESSSVEEWARLSEDMELYQDDWNGSEDPVSFSFRKGFVRLSAGNILFGSEEENLPISPYDAGPGSSVIVWIGVWRKISNSLDQFQTLISDPKTSSEDILGSLSILIRSLFSPDASSQEMEQNIIDSLYDLRHVNWDPKNERDRLRFLEAFFKQTGGEIQVRKGQYLTGGITVSSLQPMRPIPFRHVYVLGLGEGLFPGTDDTSAFNLRYISPREGDIGVRGLNQSLLYETVLSAKESLVLSFVAEDITKDESIAPSSSLLLLEQALKENILAPETSIRVRIPLNKHSKEYFIKKENPDLKKFGEKFRKTFDLSSSLLHGTKEDREYYRNTVLKNLLSEHVSQKEPQKPETVDWNDLVRFAKSPLTFHLQKRFGLYSEEISETETVSEEPFRISDNFKFMKELWSYSIDRAGSPEIRNSLDKLFSIWEKRGNTPRGIYSDVEFLTKSEKIEKISDSLSETLSEVEILSGISFGESTKKGNLLLLPSIQFQINKTEKVEIKGLKEEVLLKKEPDGSTSLILIYPNSKKRYKNLIEPFLIQCLLDCISDKNIPRSVISIFGYGDKPSVLQMDREGEENIRKKFLSDLIQEFLRPSLALISPRLWEDFPDRSELDPKVTKPSELLRKEYETWARESVQYDPEIYLDDVLRLIPYPQNYIHTEDLSICLKLYHPLTSVLRGEK